MNNGYSVTEIVEELLHVTTDDIFYYSFIMNKPTIIFKNTINYGISTSKKECIICMQLLLETNSVVILDCGHIYHEICIYKWAIKNNTCPMCREKIVECAKI